MGTKKSPTKMVRICSACEHVETPRLSKALKCERCGAPTTATEVPFETLAAAGIRTDAGLACPQCGGTQFKTKRSGGWRAGLVGGVALTVMTAGAAAPVLAASAATAKPKQVVCVTCGGVYLRGV